MVSLERSHVAFVLSLFDTGLGAVRSLGRVGIPVIGLDSDTRMPSFKSRFCTAKLCADSLHEPEELARFLLDEGRRQPDRDEHGLWRIPSGICLEKPGRYWTDEQWLTVLSRHVDRAIETGAVCSFWLHPSTDPHNMRVILPALLEYVRARWDDLWVSTMSGLVAWVQHLDEA